MLKRMNPVPLAFLHDLQTNKQTTKNTRVAFVKTEFPCSSEINSEILYLICELFHDFSAHNVIKKMSGKSCRNSWTVFGVN